VRKACLEETIFDDVVVEMFSSSQAFLLHACGALRGASCGAPSSSQLFFSLALR